MGRRAFNFISLHSFHLMSGPLRIVIDTQDLEKVLITWLFSESIIYIFFYHYYYYSDYDAILRSEVYIS